MTTTMSPLGKTLAILALNCLLLIIEGKGDLKDEYYKSDKKLKEFNLNWMSSLPDDTQLSQLSLPATHDSAAIDGSGSIIPYVTTQSMSIKQQLWAGIRVLDIRCRHVDNTFAIHHEMVFLNKWFDDVLDDVTEFLRANPREVIFMRIQKEHKPQDNTETFEKTFERYREKPQYNSYFYRGTHNVALGEVRGKIVILDRFSPPPGQYGIWWSIFESQDEYSVPTLFDIKKKVKKVLAHLEYAIHSPSEAFVANFLSGSGWGLFPSSVAKDTNKAALQWLREQWPGQRMGMIFMDYPGQGLIQAIVDANRH